MTSSFSFNITLVVADKYFYIMKAPVDAPPVVRPDMASNNITGGTGLSERSLRGPSTLKPVLPVLIDLVSEQAQLPGSALHREGRR